MKIFHCLMNFCIRLNFILRFKNISQIKSIHVNVYLLESTRRLLVSVRCYLIDSYCYELCYTPFILKAKGLQMFNESLKENDRLIYTDVLYKF